MNFRLYKNLNRLKNKHYIPVVVKLFPTWKCQLDCSYCSRHFIEENYHHKKEKNITAIEWLSKIKNFPIPIDIVYITGGGEPFLYKEISELVKLLVKEKYTVKIFSNLQKRVDLPKSKRVLISTTLHETADIKKLWDNVDFYRMNNNQVEIYEFDKSLPSEFIQKPSKKVGTKGLIKHNTKGYDQCLNYPVFCFSPDGEMFTEQASLFKHYKTKGNLTQ